MNEVITSISMLAVLIGVTGIVPQLVTMLRNRSSTGQSKLGWSLGLSGAFPPTPSRCPSPRPSPGLAAVDALVTDMHTGEFAALRDAVIAEHHRRTGDVQLVAA